MWSWFDCKLLSEYIGFTEANSKHAGTTKVRHSSINLQRMHQPIVSMRRSVTGRNIAPEAQRESLTGDDCITTSTSKGEASFDRHLGNHFKELCNENSQQQQAGAIRGHVCKAMRTPAQVQQIEACQESTKKVALVTDPCHYFSCGPV